MQIELTDEFEDWYAALGDKQRERITKIVDMLQMKGRGLLGTKYAKAIVGSKSVFELVIQISGQPFRVLYGYVGDGAVLLIGGNKKGDDRFYQREVPRAERLLENWEES